MLEQVASCWYGVLNFLECPQYFQKSYFLSKVNRFAALQIDRSFEQLLPKLLAIIQYNFISNSSREETLEYVKKEYLTRIKNIFEVLLGLPQSPKKKLACSILLVMLTKPFGEKLEIFTCFREVWQVFADHGRIISSIKDEASFNVAFQDFPQFKQAFHKLNSLFQDEHFTSIKYQGYCLIDLTQTGCEFYDPDAAIFLIQTCGLSEFADCFSYLKQHLDANALITQQPAAIDNPNIIILEREKLQEIILLTQRCQMCFKYVIPAAAFTVSSASILVNAAGAMTMSTAVQVFVGSGVISIMCCIFAGVFDYQFNECVKNQSNLFLNPYRRFLLCDCANKSGRDSERSHLLAGNTVQ